MKKLVMNSLTNIVVLSGLVLGLIVFWFIRIESEKPVFPTAKIHNTTAYEQLSLRYELVKKGIISEIGSKHKYLDLSFRPKFTPNSKFTSSIRLNAYQALAYKKTSSAKTKLLHHILNNAEQRSKFKYVMKKAQELKLPNELALIPVIESEYKNKAVSPKGAAGLWQLMPGTAKIFGLSSRQRFEMAASTRAALLHLKDLYREYGNWELAIAAYNAGDGKVNKALKRKPHAKTVQDLNLPHETRQYVVSFFQLQNALKAYDLTENA